MKWKIHVYLIVLCRYYVKSYGKSYNYNLCLFGMGKVITIIKTKKQSIRINA